MRVLVTNDDGVESPGLHALTRALVEAGHDVVVVAPSGERSGSGAAIGRLHRAGPIAWTEVEWPDLPGVCVHAVDLPPAGAVYAGCLGAFGPRPDAVASGINLGLNYGHLVIHSGTVGAALTAGVLEIPAVAVSIGWGEELHWTTAAALTPGALEWAAQREQPAVVNLNLPNVPLSKVRGVREGRLCPFNERWSSTAKTGELTLDYEGYQREPDPGTDLGLVRAGYAAVTVLSGVDAGNATGLAEATARALDARAERAS